MTGDTLGPDDRTTVVVITRDRRPELLRTLRTLRDLPERPPVIVTDNGSADGTADAVARDHPEVLLLRPGRNLGAVGRNLAVRRVRTPYVAFCDDDTWWEPGSLRRAADAPTGERSLHLNTGAGAPANALPAECHMSA
ncbi:glycosyltransferase family 2 protein, partial [Streptomyces sp. NPDC003362]